MQRKKIGRKLLLTPSCIVDLFMAIIEYGKVFTANLRVISVILSVRVVSFCDYSEKEHGSIYKYKSGRL